MHGNAALILLSLVSVPYLSNDNFTAFISCYLTESSFAFTDYTPADISTTYNAYASLGASFIAYI